MREPGIYVGENEVAEINRLRAEVDRLRAERASMLDALATCRRWFARHSPTAPTILPGSPDAEHPMLTMLRAVLAPAAPEG